MAKGKINTISSRAFYGLITLIAFVIIVLINIVFSFIDFRADFTEDQRYSLTTTTVDFLENDTSFQDKILFKIYLDGEFPAEVKRLQTAIRDKLDEFRYYAGEKIQYQFINPNEGSEATQKEIQDEIFNKGTGIRPVTIAYQSEGSTNFVKIWAGASVSYQNQPIEYIRFLDGGRYQLGEQFNQRIQKSVNTIEYKLMRTIAHVTRTKKKKLAFIHGHGELDVPYTQGARIGIRDDYIIKDVKINNSLHGLDQFDGIIIANPSEKFTNKEKFILDQYLLQGGNIMIFNSPVEVNNDSIRYTGKTHSTRKNTGISELLFDYGIKINDDLVVDANYARFMMPGIPKGYINWYFYVYAQGTSHPISSMVRPVKLPYCSSLQFVKTGNNTTPSVILTSSSNSKSYGIVPLVSIGVERVFGEHPIFQDQPNNKNNQLMLGAIMEGEFESAFKNRIVSAYIDNPNASFLKKSARPGKIMVVGNGTFFKNSYYDSVLIREENRYQYVPRLPKGNEIDELLDGSPMGNFAFFENCVDYMLGEKTLLSIRSRTIQMHPLDELKIATNGVFYKVINIAVPVIAILILAVIVFIMRRIKYVKK